MSIFRDEFGPWYMSMFLLLFFGKVWGWLCDGRIEFLEQQQPRNPRLFHFRLCAALGLYILGATSMLLYCLDEVIYEARPGVMIMFVFEWAIICVSVLSTCAKYGLWTYERRVLIQQEATRRAELRSETPDLNADDIDVNELDLPGWEAKGSWVFTLDIAIDFLKLIAYIAFFCVLTMFYGIPIYIIRDLYMTMRSFIRRITDYIKYENATRDMHALYPDATPEELSTDNTCIVCREEMHPWIGNHPAAQPDDAQPRATSERNRPKKLPCGHILHFHCLRSWLERQQACPICRRSVLRPLDRGIAAQLANQPQQGQGPNAPAQPRDGAAAPPRQQGFNFQFGNFRFQLGAGLQGNDPAVANPIPGLVAAPAVPNQPQQPAANLPVPTPTQPVQADAANQAPQAPQAGSSTQPAPSLDNSNAFPLFDLPNVDETFPTLRESQPLIRHHVLHTQLNAMEAYLWQELAHAQIGIDRINQLRQLQSELTRSRLAMTNHVTTSLPPNHLLNGPLVLEATQDPSSSLVLPGHNNTMNTVIRLPPGWTSVPLGVANPTRTEEAAVGSQGSENRAPLIPTDGVPNMGMHHVGNPEDPHANAFNVRPNNPGPPQVNVPGFPNVADMIREAQQQAFQILPGQIPVQAPGPRPVAPGQPPMPFGATPNPASPQIGGFVNQAQIPTANVPAMFSNIADMMRHAQQHGAQVHQFQTGQIPTPGIQAAGNPHNAHHPVPHATPGFPDMAEMMRQAQVHQFPTGHIPPPVVQVDGNPHNAHAPVAHTPQGFPDIAEMMRQAQEQATRQWEQNQAGANMQNVQNVGNHNVFGSLMQQMQQRINQDIRAAGPSRGSRPPSTSPSRNFQARPPGPASQTPSGRQSPTVTLNGAVINTPGPTSTVAPNGTAPSPLRHSESQAASSATTNTTPGQNAVSSVSQHANNASEQHSNSSFSTTHTYDNGQGPSTITASWSFDDVPASSETLTTENHETGHVLGNNEDASGEDSRGRPRPATVEDVPEEDLD
jgi:E3 ubiquitin-protein ligase synoviolin